MVNTREELTTKVDKTKIAAYLYAVHHMDQSDIAKQLKLSQSQISRLLKRAEKEDLLIVSRSFDDNKVSIQQLSELNKLAEPVKLTEKLKHLIPQNNVLVRRVTIFDSGSESTDKQDIKRRLSKFGKLSANRVVELLKLSKVAGVSWGSTIGHMVIDGVDQLYFEDSSKKAVQFVPVCGELMGIAANEFTSTRLANHLHRKISSLKDKQYFLSGVPAYIPLKYKGKERNIIEKYIKGCASYQKIFSGKTPLINEVDTFITSISTIDRPLGSGDIELANAAGISIDKMRSVIIGDFGGALIPKENLSLKDEKLVNDLNSIWIGINLENIKQIAERASDDFPGNIVVAIGRNKAPMIHTCLLMGLVNELIIDRDLANALNEIL